MTTSFFRKTHSWRQGFSTARRGSRGYESLEPRLALTWAGIPPVSITPPASATKVALDSQSDAVGNGSIASTEIDYYSFTATVSGAYTISATTPASSLDTVLGVFSASGERLAYNDDIARSNTDSRLTVTLTAGASYYIGLTNYTARSRGSYVWSIDGPSSGATDDAYENNDTRAAAYDLGTLTAAKSISQLILADSSDWYKFTTTAVGTSASSVAISFQNSQGNVNLGLYNSSGSRLGYSTGTDNSETISLNGLAVGT
jgi:hypothetical protein